MIEMVSNAKSIKVSVDTLSGIRKHKTLSKNLNVESITIKLHSVCMYLCIYVLQKSQRNLSLT